MMRLGRRASLLVALFLLISAATAYAECAWVLWLSSSERETPTSLAWSGYPTWAACERERQQSAAMDKDVESDKGKRVNALWRCLPEGTDPNPRGPKGK